MNEYQLETWEHDGPWTRAEMREAIDRVRLSTQESADFGESNLDCPTESLMASMLGQVMTEER